MIKPPELSSDHGQDVWDTLTAAAAGDVETLRRLLQRDPSLASEYSPLGFAVREGHLEAVQVLLGAGANPDQMASGGDTLIEVARDRGFDAVAGALDEALQRRGRVTPSETHADHPIHASAEAGDLRRVRALLDADPTLVHRSDRAGGTPLHRAVIGRAGKVVALLLDRGADVHAVHGARLGSREGYAPDALQAIDFAIWGGPRRVRPSVWSRRSGLNGRPADHEMSAPKAVDVSGRFSSRPPTSKTFAPCPRSRVPTWVSNPCRGDLSRTGPGRS